MLFCVLVSRQSHGSADFSSILPNEEVFLCSQAMSDNDGANVRTQPCAYMLLVGKRSAKYLRGGRQMYITNHTKQKENLQTRDTATAGLYLME